MNIAFYNGVSGMVTFQQDMDRLAHNMANVQTVGYKPARTVFSDILYTQMATNDERPFLNGHGVKTTSSDLLMEQGILSTTNYSLDFALVGDGFFAVERGGETQYTRNGAFDVGLEGNKAFLVTSDGGYVLDATGKRVELTKEEGSQNYSAESVKDVIGVYAFANPYGLEQTDGSSFRPTTISGEAKAINTGNASANKEELPYQLKEGALELSGVNMADAMVNVMLTSRAFQFNSRMVQTADQIDEIVNTLR